ncbi:MAG TPA: DUF1587 domain-containing protein, partial [Polyangiales bacterium]|nr:DUF1587 domain-containing protein [Polyangiales bacterium]
MPASSHGKHKLGFRRFWLLWALLSALGPACNAGLIADPSGSNAAVGGGSVPGKSQSPGTSAPPPAADGGGAAQSTFEPAAATLRKLTVEQYRNSVSDLIGAGIDVPTDLEPDTSENGFVSIGAAHATLSPSAVEKFETAAYDVAAQALTADRRASFVGCTPKATIDTACTTQFVQSFGKRAFRRPL